jgi:hypothetical protein
MPKDILIAIVLGVLVIFFEVAYIYKRLKK